MILVLLSIYLIVLLAMCGYVAYLKGNVMESFGFLMAWPIWIPFFVILWLCRFRR